MKKILFASICSMLSVGAFAEEMPQMPMGAPNGEHHQRGNMMEQLTDEQKACIAEYGCAQPEHPVMPENAEQPNFGEKPEMGNKPSMDEKPEMTAEQKESMECMQKAMEACGVEMPKMGERPEKGERPSLPDKSMNVRGRE